MKETSVRAKQNHVKTVVAEIDPLYLAGKTSSEIAIILSIGTRTVERYKTQRAGCLARQKDAELRRKEIVDCLEKGMDVDDISIELNLSVQTIRKQLKNWEGYTSQRDIQREIYDKKKVKGIELLKTSIVNGELTRFAADSIARKLKISRRTVYRWKTELEKGTQTQVENTSYVVYV